MDTQVRLVRHFKYTFSIFKQHYIYFHTFFSPIHVFQKITNNTTQISLPNGS